MRTMLKEFFDSNWWLGWLCGEVESLGVGEEFILGGEMFAEGGKEEDNDIGCVFGDGGAGINEFGEFDRLFCGGNGKDGL